MQTIRLVYFGTPDFSARFLENLLNDTSLPIDVILVVTQPDKPVGRTQALTPTPVKQRAQKYHVPVYDGPVTDLHVEADLALLYAYGEIIPPSLIASFPKGFWNVHPSLLPKYRNVAPMVYPLMLGDRKTGVTLIQLDEKLDHGPILAQKEYAILPKDHRTDLEQKLTDLAGEMTTTLLANISIGTSLIAKEQDHAHATYTRMMKKDDGYIPVKTLTKYLASQPITSQELPQILQEYLTKYGVLEQWLTGQSESSIILYNLFKALSPWPGLWTTVEINGQPKRLKLLDMEFNEGTLMLTKVQLEGKTVVDFATFQKAYSLF